MKIGIGPHFECGLQPLGRGRRGSFLELQDVGTCVMWFQHPPVKLVSTQELMRLRGRWVPTGMFNQVSCDMVVSLF